MLGIIRLVLIGIVIGMANVIPGVSGGTLAVVFNIYDKFVNAITLNFKKLWAFNCISEYRVFIASTPGYLKKISKHILYTM